MSSAPDRTPSAILRLPLTGSISFLYSGSHCSWATSIALTVESDKEFTRTPGTPVPIRGRLGGPMSLHTAIELPRLAPSVLGLPALDAVLATEHARRLACMLRPRCERKETQ